MVMIAHVYLQTIALLKVINMRAEVIFLPTSHHISK